MHLRNDKFDIELDGKMVYKGLETIFIQVNNGKLAGGRIMVNPFGLINDGLNECVLLKSPGETGVMKAISLFEEQKAGGSHAYSSELLTYRHKEAKIYNKNTLKGVKVP